MIQEYSVIVEDMAVSHWLQDERALTTVWNWYHTSTEGNSQQWILGMSRAKTRTKGVASTGFTHSVLPLLEENA